MASAHADERTGTGEMMLKMRNNQLDLLHQWVHNVNNMPNLIGLSVDPDTVKSVCGSLKQIAEDFADEYPFYKDYLNYISQMLFIYAGNPMVMPVLNPVVFGELRVIEWHLYNRPIDLQFWNNIHPRISRVSKQLYADGHFSASAEKAVKEVETRLRELFRKLKPTATVPSKIGDIIGALLSENGAYHFVDTSTTSGKDYRRGIQSLVEGMFAAYRNPSAHENIEYSRIEAEEQIMLASQLMYVLQK